MPVAPSERADSTAEDAARTARRQSREAWPLRRFALGDEPADDLSAMTSAGERFAMVWPLSQLAWRLAGRAIPDYARAQMPGKILRADSAE